MTRSSAYSPTYALQRSSCPGFFHPCTNRRMYRLLSKGLIGDPCGVPRPSSRLRVLRRLFPRSSVSSTGASSHILIRCSIAPSTTRRATDFHQFGVWNTVKVAAEIRIDNLSMSGVNQLVDVLHGIQRAAVCPIGILLRLQVGLENRFENALFHQLSQSSCKIIAFIGRRDKQMRGITYGLFGATGSVGKALAAKLAERGQP